MDNIVFLSVRDGKTTTISGYAHGMNPVQVTLPGDTSTTTTTDVQYTMEALDGFCVYLSEYEWRRTAFIRLRRHIEIGLNL